MEKSGSLGRRVIICYSWLNVIEYIIGLMLKRIYIYVMLIFGGFCSLTAYLILTKKINAASLPGGFYWLGRKEAIALIILTNVLFTYVLFLVKRLKSDKNQGN